MNDCVNYINEALNSGQFVESIFLEKAFSLEPVPLFPVTYLKGRKVLRSRPNDFGVFDNLRDISYPPSHAAKLNRLSKEGQSMFYCSGFSTSSERTNCIPRIVNVLEICQELINSDVDGSVDFTVGVWLVRKNLKLLAFPINIKNFEKMFKEMKQMQAYYDKAINTYSKEAVRFARYIGELISSKQFSCLYEITASYAKYLLYDRTGADDIDGILYPSVQSGGEGVNICLKPEAVDNSLKLLGARKERLIKQGNKSQIIDLRDADVGKDGKLIWKQLYR